MNFAPVAARRSAAGPNAGRELKLTPIVRQQENAQASASALGRLQGSSRISVVVHPCAFVRVGSVNKKGQLGWVASIEQQAANYYRFLQCVHAVVMKLVAMFRRQQTDAWHA